MKLGRRIRRQTVALVAAYAVAIHAILLALAPIAPTRPATPFASMLCSQGGPDGNGHQSHHDLPCAAICAALGYGVAGPVPPLAVVAVAMPVAVEALAPIGDWVAPAVALRGPQAPRGPPSA